ncbi:MAG TPA: ABC transporter permease [Caldimonas sp.]|nr:ABC transporter permease [Caldimonas sp.]
MLRLEARPEPSRAMSMASPLIALAITVVIGTLLFVVLGKDPLRGLGVFFVEPLKGAYALSELAIKATPLLLIALGLAVCFRSNIWNIGAEGQFVLGAIFASGVAMQATKDTGHWIFIAVLAASVVGGMLWAAIVAFLRDRFNASEILVSLMLVYVAEQLLNYFVYGPWKDPHGYNFPQTVTFLKSTQVPRLFDTYRINIGAVGALVAVGAFWVLLFRTYAGFQLQVGGLAPAAARYAGFSARRALWTTMLVSGGMAGLAGGLEVAGPLNQLTPHVPAGYGFAAIIVAFVGRLHPVGIVFSAILMSMFYIGGELSQSRLGLPQSLTGVFQGLLLLALLACDTLIAYRVRWRTGVAGAAATSSSASPPAASAPATSELDDAPLSPVVATSALPARKGS